MRIISGRARGTKLYTLEGENTRPTLDRVKESLFNIIQNKIEYANFLDLFSGSGAIGLEALSRGAKKTIFCDSSKQAIEIINKNIKKTHLEDNSKVYNLDYKKALKEIKEKQDIIYIDPPYKTDFAIQAINEIIKLNIIDENSIIIVETDDKEIIENIEKLEIEIQDKRKYGRAYLIFLNRR